MSRRRPPWRVRWRAPRPPARSDAGPSWADAIARARAAVIADGLVDWDAPLDLGDFTTRLGHARDLAITTAPVELGSTAKELCGLCLRFDHSATVFYLWSDNPLRRRHNLIHELGHLLFDHSTVGPLAPFNGRQAASERVTSALQVARDPSYDRVAETEADALAALLLGHSSLRVPHHRWTATRELHARAARVEATFI